MRPLVVRAWLVSGLAINPDMGVSLDGLLAYQYVLRTGQLRAIRSAADLSPVEIPIAKSECGRYYLASYGSFTISGYETANVTRQPPIGKYRELGCKAKAIDVSAGADKYQRDPISKVLPAGGVVTWWCVGDLAAVRREVSTIPALGRRHGAGLGEVYRWAVEECDPWGPGFPCVDPSGQPTRPLPRDTPGELDAEIGSIRLMPPYWLADGAEPAMVRRGGWA